MDLIEKYASQNHFGYLLGMEFQILSPGEIEYRLKIEEKHLATPIAAHGGVIASLVDASLGIACLSKVALLDKVVSTIEFSLKFHKPAVLGAELVAQARVISAGNRILVSETKIYDGVTLIASASGTFNAYPKEKAGY
jgi:uncharacterized protein (TIGR00369 family)